MRLPKQLSPEAHQAIIECLRIAARRGRQLTEERERAERDAQVPPTGPACTDKTEEPEAAR